MHDDPQFDYKIDKNQAKEEQEMPAMDNKIADKPGRACRDTTLENEKSRKPEGTRELCAPASLVVKGLSYGIGAPLHQLERDTRAIADDAVRLQPQDLHAKEPS